MHWKSETVRSFLLFVAVASEFSATVSSFDSKCPPLRLVSGRSRYRWRGRSVRFNCMRGFQLVGVKYATCMNGKWDADVPICVKHGCRAPSTTHVNGQFIESYRGAVVKIVCNPGYALLGSPSVYCNGTRWNETFPVCRVADTNPASSCDFEDLNLCGWSQDPMHDFYWKRQNASTPSGDGEAGPALEPPRGGNGTGFYMHMGSSAGARTENDTARLYSPVYPAEYSNGTCFRFWYHMQGTPAGQLKVYIKPEGVDLYNLIPSFWVNAEEGRSWAEAFFPIEPTDAPFQVVVEGVRGPGHVSDMAFDDVRLAFGDECVALEEMTSSSLEFSTWANPAEDAIDLFTCKSRCEEEAGTANATDDGRCNCHETCDRDGTCCSDYFDWCSYFASTTTTSQTDATASTSSSSPVVPRATPSGASPRLPPAAASPTTSSTEPPREITPPSPSFPKRFNNESNEIDPGKPFPDAPPPPTPPRLTSVTPRRENPPRAPPPLPPPPTPAEPEKPLAKNVTRPRSRGPADRTKPTSTTKTTEKKTSKSVAGRTRGQKVEEKGGEAGLARTTSSPPSTPPKVTKNTRPSSIKLTFAEKPSSPLLSNESRFQKGKPRETPGKEPPQAIKFDKAEESGESSLRGIAEVGGTSLAVLVALVLGGLWYRRSRSKKAERETMVEDSDVRFLTSDEVLDFTLARPADDDL